MKSILIDIGNSSCCKAAVADGTLFKSVHRVPKGMLRQTIDDIVSVEGHVDTICMSSVAAQDCELSEWLRGKCGSLVEVDFTTPMPITLDYDTPMTLGADRIAAAVGAHAMFPDRDCIVFDFGTALTVDFIDALGRFSGGNISPGLSMRFNAVHQYTDRLPLVSPYRPERVGGKSTAEAINNGVVLGIVFEVERYINSNPGCRVVFTGGGGLFFAKMLKTPIFVVCNLVLAGLSKIAQLNVQSRKGCYK